VIDGYELYATAALIQFKEGRRQHGPPIDVNLLYLPQPGIKQR